jgi:hypothetical protein
MLPARRLAKPPVSFRWDWSRFDTETLGLALGLIELEAARRRRGGDAARPDEAKALLRSELLMTGRRPQS